jgi:hypothetical protein
MLYTLKRWIAGASADAEWGGLPNWAKQQGWGIKRVREVGGLVIDGAMDGAAGQLPWRLEWGPSQREYITGRELRMRMELQLPSDLQMLVLSRPLMEVLEKAAYEHFTQTSQTFIDGTAPEEMRWLSMFSKVAVADKNLRSRFGVVASEPNLAASWLDGELSAQLNQATQDWMVSEPPFILMTLRGRLYLRLGCDEPRPNLVHAVVGLFSKAAQHAHRVGQSFGPVSSNEWPSTAITAWQAQLDAEDDRPRGSIKHATPD